MRLFVLILIVILAGTACTTAADIQALRDRDFKLTWIEGFPSTPAGVATPTIRFGSDGRMSGNTGCNSAGGSYTAEGDRLSITGPISVTKRACVEPAGNELERAYLDVLERMRRFRIAGDELELLDDAGTVLARFRSAA